jgi:soluble lytic murein transglycosylase-like protein
MAPRLQIIENMNQVKTSRPFQQRFLDGYDRHELRSEVQKVKPKRLSGLRKKYATWALGGALAIGGMGIPMKVGTMLSDTKTASTAQLAGDTPEKETTRQIAADLSTAQQIASQVAGGVTAATQDVAKTVAPTAVAEQVAEAPAKMKVVTEDVKRAFFQKQVPFGSLIYNEAKKNNLPPELVAAVAHTESKFKPTARSHAGAQGLMQLVPRTGRWMGARNLMDPTQNVQAGAKYLRYLTDRFDGNMTKAIAAYNAGEGNVQRFGGVPPFKETRNYIKRVQSYRAELGEQIDNHIAETQQQAEMAQ